MAFKIQLKRGTEANKPDSLQSGEVYLSLDTCNMWVGQGKELPLTKFSSGSNASESLPSISFSLPIAPSVSLYSAVVVAPCDIKITDIDIICRTATNTVQAPSALTDAILNKNGILFDSREFTLADTNFTALNLLVYKGDKLDLRLSGINGLSGTVSVVYRGIKL